MSLNLNKELLDALFDTISSEVYVLEAQQDPDHTITGFRSLIANKESHIDDDSLDRELFDRFVSVIRTGEPLNIIFQHGNDQSKWYHIRAKKFNNGLIVQREDITASKQAEEKIM